MNTSYEKSCPYSQSFLSIEASVKFNGKNLNNINRSLQANDASIDSDVFESSVTLPDSDFNWIKTPRSTKLVEKRRRKENSSDMSMRNSSWQKNKETSSQEKSGPLMAMKILSNASSNSVKEKSVLTSRIETTTKSNVPFLDMKSRLLASLPCKLKTSHQYACNQIYQEDRAAPDNTQLLKGSKRRNVEAWVKASVAMTPTSPPMALSPHRNIEKSKDSIDPSVEEVLIAIYGPDWNSHTKQISKTDVKKPAPRLSRGFQTDVKPKKVILSKEVENNRINVKPAVRRKIFDDRSPSAKRRTDSKFDIADTPVQAKLKNTVSGKVKTSASRKRKVSISSMEDEESPLLKRTPALPNCNEQRSTNKFVARTPRRTFLASLSVSTPTSITHPEAQQYKLNFSKKKDELVSRLFKLFNTEVFDGRLPEEMAITWNSKLRGTAGFCYNKRKKSGGQIMRNSRLELSPRVLDRADRLRDTLIHEMCHAAAWIVDDTIGGHGAVWHAWAKRAMLRFPELPAIRRCHNYEIATKFTYRCTGCGYSINRQSRSIDTQRKRCGHCLGNLELLYNKKKKGVSEAPEFETTRTLRPPNNFAVFVKDNYKRLKESNPDKKHGEIMKIVSREYALFKNATTPKSGSNH